jgi:anti-sigma regulatory factor (Ser/Thr protein kinase)
MRMVQVVLENRPKEQQRLLRALEEFAAANHLPATVRQAADLALEEHLTNIISYAHDDNLPHPIRIQLELVEDQLVVEVRDQGKPFNPLLRPQVDTTVPLEAKPIGGLGIHLMRRFMDKLEYRREGGQNILTMRKRLGRET